MTATKRCTKCGVDKPATPEYFYGNRREKDGFNVMCKECVKEYQRDYYSKGGRRESKDGQGLLLVGDNRRKVMDRYKVGEVINLKKLSDKGTLIGAKGTHKAKILKFYPHYVLCMVGNYKECYTYWDLLLLSGSIKQGEAKGVARYEIRKKSGHKGITWDSYGWKVQLWENGGPKYIGRYKELEDAVKAKEDYLKGATY